MMIFIWLKDDRDKTCNGNSNEFLQKYEEMCNFETQKYLSNLLRKIILKR